MIWRELAGRNFRFGELAPASVRSAAVPALTTCAQGELRDSGPAPSRCALDAASKRVGGGELQRQGRARGFDGTEQRPTRFQAPRRGRPGRSRRLRNVRVKPEKGARGVREPRRCPRFSGTVCARLGSRAKLQPQRHVRRTEAGEKCEPASSPAGPGADRVWPRRSGPLSLPDFFLKMKLSS